MSFSAFLRKLKDIRDTAFSSFFLPPSGVLILVLSLLQDAEQSSLLEDAVISEQEIKEFHAKKQDMQSQREQLRERLRHQFQMMCIHSAGCLCKDRPVNGLKLNLK